ncbi:MAG: CCA tRNA nucleotidyltransferase [Oscillospiraceae bacterium]|nr:CCA tRNA nucleotidyltransferase [Oscillospiraceae bacterium]
MDVNFPDFIYAMLQKLSMHNFQAYLVGGCVRDVVLGMKPHDYDITTNAKPQEIIEIFGSENCSAYGRAFGTVGVYYHNGFAEITTYRTETDYTDYRHPNQVYFANDILEDLARRDFTCNAMAWNPETGLLDVYHGKQDLENHVLRCVGVPSARFREDALRILRGMRFSAKLNLKPEILTHSAMLAGAFRLKYISAERIFSELCNMLMGDNITEILLTYPEILAVWIPEIYPCIAFSQHSKHHDFTVWEHIARAVGNAPKNLTVRMTMLFHDIAKPVCYQVDSKGGHFKTHALKSSVMANDILLRLKSDNYFRKQVCRLIALHRDIPDTMPQVRKLIGNIGYEEFALFLQILESDRISKLNHAPESNRKIKKLSELAEICKNQNLCCCIKDLEINGNDLLKLGFYGKQIKLILNLALEAVISEKCVNTKQELLSFVKNLHI